jgi:branched-chain amino acid transport system substrate-binding protein
MPKHRSRIFALVLGLPLLLSLLVACGAGTTTNTTQQGTITIKIGSDFPVSGDDTTGGLPAQNGVQFAVDEANSTNFLPGYHFELDHRDDVGAGNKHDPTKGQQNVAALIGDAQVAGIVGPLNSSVAYSELPTTNQAPIAQISPSNSSDCLTQNTPEAECGGQNSKLASVRPTGKVTYFRTSTLDQNQGLALALFAQSKGYKTVFIIDDTEAYGAGLASNFETAWKKLNLTVLDHRSIAVTQSYENILTTIAPQHPDLIFFGGNDSTGGIPIRQQMKNVAGLENTPFIVGDGTKTSNFATNIIPLGGGPVFASVLGLDPSQVPAAAKFVTDYNKKYGATNFGAYSPGGYDDAWIIIKAIKTAIQDKKAVAPKNSNDSAAAPAFRQAVIDAIQNIQYDGVTGHHSFDANGDTTNKSISVYTLGTVGQGDGWKYLTKVDAVLP